MGIFGGNNKHDDPEHTGSSHGGGIPGCSCQTISCSVIFLIFFGIIGSVFIVLQKPVSIWDPIVNVLNGNIELPDVNLDEYTVETIEASIDEQIDQFEGSEITLSESEFTVLARDGLPGINDLFVDIEEDSMKFIWIMDERVEDNPLYGVAELRAENDNELYIEKLGTEVVASPEFLNRAIANGALGILRIDNKERSDSLIREVLKVEDSFKIDKIELRDDQITLTVTIDISFRR